MSRPREASADGAPDPEEPEDELRRLFDAALNGDRRAEEELWKTVRLLVYKLASAVCKRRRIQDADTDDIVQNVVLILLRQPAEKLLKIKSWNAFLFTIVHHCVINHYHERRRIASREVSLDPAPADGEVSGENLREVIAGFDDTLSKMYAGELVEIANGILKSWPEEKAEIFCLYLQGYKHREIADRLDMPVNTVSVVIYRMKHQLKDRLDSTRGYEVV